MDKDGRYPITRAGKQVGHIEYGERGTFRCWRVVDTRDTHPRYLAAASTVAKARQLARWHFDAKPPAWLKEQAQ